jgi:hypothetical protein
MKLPWFDPVVNAATADGNLKYIFAESYIVFALRDTVSTVIALVVK